MPELSTCPALAVEEMFGGRWVVNRAFSIRLADLRARRLIGGISNCRGKRAGNVWKCAGFRMPAMCD
jgi:hypothetical protein